MSQWKPLLPNIQIMFLFLKSSHEVFNTMKEIRGKICHYSFFLWSRTSLISVNSLKLTIDRIDNHLLFCKLNFVIIYNIWFGASSKNLSQHLNEMIVCNNDTLIFVTKCQQYLIMCSVPLKRSFISQQIAERSAAINSSLG